jgi:hypothetical protein
MPALEDFVEGIERDLPDLSASKNPVRAVERLVLDWLVALPEAERGYRFVCPVEQWEGVRPHHCLFRHDWPRGLIIRCEGGHTKRRVLEGLLSRLGA